MVHRKEAESLPGGSPDEPVEGRYLWIGPGQTGFLIPLKDLQPPEEMDSEEERPSTQRLRGVAEVKVLFDESLRGEEHRSLAGFFRAGGAECHVLPVPESFRSWCGANGGPGERTGFYTFLDVEEVGNVVVPPMTATRIDEFLRLARRCRELFFFIEEKARRSRTEGEKKGSRKKRSIGPLNVLRPLPNVALLRAPVPEEWSAGALAGYLEARGPGTGTVASTVAREVVGKDRESRSGFQPAVPLARESLESLKAWRYWAGLRRSLDRGSRWLLFEPNHPLVWRRLERETRAFLHQLTLDGILPPWTGTGCDVHCGPDPAGEGEEGGRILLSVKVPGVGPRRWTVSPGGPGGPPLAAAAGRGEVKGVASRETGTQSGDET